ncbi:MAG: glycosyltransferase family 4 protein, partial [Rickettsiaceae bacterium]|nr:glycosyltransferase family 4 protein [Rickettsiaceae bacterium]
MKLLLYWDYFQSYHIDRARSVYATNQDIVIFSLFDTNVDSHVVTKSEFICLGLSQHNTVRSLFNFINYLRQQKPRLVFINGYGRSTALTALIYCIATRTKSVLMSDSQHRDKRRNTVVEFLKSVIVKRYDYAFVSGEYARKYLIQLGIPPARILIGYNAVDNNFFKQRQTGQKDNYLLCVSRFIEKKNIVNLIKWFCRYRATYPLSGLSLKIVGQGPLQERITKTVCEHGGESFVSVNSYKDKSELADLYAKARIFILPSHTNEQWGLVVNEAMAAGCPVLVSNVCGCAPDLVEEGVNG